VPVPGIEAAVEPGLDDVERFVLTLEASGRRAGAEAALRVLVRLALLARSAIGEVHLDGEAGPEAAVGSQA